MFWSMATRITIRPLRDSRNVNFPYRGRRRIFARTCSRRCRCCARRYRKIRFRFSCLRGIVSPMSCCRFSKSAAMWVCPELPRSSRGRWRAKTGCGNPMDISAWSPGRTGRISPICLCYRKNSQNKFAPDRVARSVSSRIIAITMKRSGIIARNCGSFSAIIPTRAS